MSTCPPAPLCERLTVPAAIAAAAILTGCGQPPAPPVAPPVTPEVSYIVIKPQRLAVSTELAGRTAPVLIAEVRPQVSGLVQSRLFKEGSEVQAGQLLYQVDPSTYDAALERSNASVVRAEAQVDVARLKARRTAELAAIKAVSQQDADDTDAALKQAEADLLSARAALTTSRIDVERSRITSPISGRIGRSTVTPGALVTANQPAALATVQKLDPILVDLTQSSNDTLLLKRLLTEGKVKPGSSKVKLMFEDGTTYAREGSLQFAEASVDQGTGSVTLRAEFPNPTGELLPGMYVRAVIEAGVVEEAMLVPQRAVSRDSAGNATAFVVGADNKLTPRILVTRRSIGDQWLISDGLKAGEFLAVKGQDKVRPGMVVDAKPYQPEATGGSTGTSR